MAQIQCSRCRHAFWIDASDLDVHATGSTERKMGIANSPDLLYRIQPREFEEIIATTSHFTPAAKTFAKERSSTRWAMDLKAFDDIVGWIKDTSGRR